MREETTEKAKRAKAKSRFVVLRMLSDRLGGWAIEPCFCTCTTDCLTWIRKHGQAGEVYRPALLRGDPVEVNVEMIEKRKLRPAVAEELVDESEDPSK